MQLKITTFNVENLFNRYSFLDLPWEQRNYEKFVQALDVVSIASRKGDLVSDQLTVTQRNNTAQAILDAEPDILAVQEIENLYTLRIFNDTYLDNYFDRLISIDGNDPRGIDVGLMIKASLAVKIINIRTHIDDAKEGASVKRGSARDFGYLATSAIFSRDCLEVDIAVDDKVITLLINHFKSQDREASSIKRRRLQAEKVAEIALTAANQGKYPVVLGDLNMDPNKPQTLGDKSLEPLLTSSILQDPFPSDTWTHYYVPEKAVSRLDYILPHKDIEVISTDIVQKGLTTKCKQYTGPRYSTIGQEHTEASDHCPTSVVVKL